MPLIRMAAKTQFTDAAEREWKSTSSELCAIEDQYSTGGESASGLRQNGYLAFGTLGEGVQDLTGWVEMPESQLFFRDRKMAEAIYLLREWAAGGGIDFQVVEICSAAA